LLLPARVGGKNTAVAAHFPKLGWYYVKCSHPLIFSAETELKAPPTEIRRVVIGEMTSHSCLPPLTLDLSPRQRKQLQKLYFAAVSAEGQLRFAEKCLELSRRGFSVQSFFHDEGLADCYQELLDESLANYIKGKAGHLYLAVHPIYSEGLYKVGATRKTPEQRMQSLTTAGIPGQFTLVKSWAVPEPFAAEAHCARTLSQRRVQREFYEGTFPELTAAIDGVVDEEWRMVRQLSPAIEMPLTSK
jgi:hypothetical protein